MNRGSHKEGFMSTTIRCVALVSILAISVFSFGTPVIGQEDPTDVGFFGSHKVAADKKDPSKLPFIGAWRINLDKSAPALRKRFAPTTVNIFTAENGGLRHSIFQDYPPKVDTYRTVFDERYRSYWFKLDGKNIYENPQGPNGQGQTVAMWLIDRNTIFRARATKGVVDEWVLYRVSPDGKTLVWTPFNADGDSGQMYWEKVNLR
jgi:hypothetical protein